ncbi:hypothetical protein STEG23_009541 [Scotinomys teguina]
MGQTATTPLSLTLSHWTDVRARAHNEGVEVRKKKWITLCEAEWDPVALTNLIESILVTHRPTWDDCQQLLQTLLTLEEKQRVVLEARKQVPGDDGRPTQLPNLIDAAFPLTRPDWDFNAPEGRDLLTKLKAQIHFGETGPTVTGPWGAPLQILTLHLEEEYRLYEPEPKGGPLPEINTWLEEFPQAWAETGGLGLAHDQPPLVIPLKASATPVSIKQYPMSREAYEGIKPPIRRLLDQGVLRPCQSPWNTPLLPVKKPGTGDYRPVQDLREVNKRVEDIHPTVPNPYNLMSTLSPTHAWYTVLDLKDAFFSLRLHPQSQLLFAFEWKDPELGLSGQLTWTRLPQGFKNSPTLFDEALHADLAEFQIEHPTLTLLQYVDDLLLAARDQSECLEGTRALLEHLGQKGYRASAKKAQICQDKVTYLGYTLSGGQRWLTDARKEAIIAIPPPRTPGRSEHDCLQILAEAHGTRPDLTDQPLNNPDLVWYTDGSSFLENGERRAGAAVTTETEVIWASALPPGTSAQRAELIALTQALRLAEGKRLTVYTDSRYAFATAHIHGEIYRRRGLLTSAGKEIKNKEEILDLLRALFLPAKLSIVHCPGHQKGDSMVARGNRLADQTARAVATQSAQSIPLLNIQEGQPTGDPLPYSPEDHELAKKMGASWDPEKQAYALQDKLIMPTSHTRYMLRFLHALTHLSKNKMKALLADETSGAVLLNQDRVLQQRGHRPGIHWETDFTEVKPGLYGYRYLLVFVDTFSGWIEAFPTKKETANMVVKKMLEEIFPSPTLEAHLQALQLVQKEVWKPLAQAYQEQLSRPVVPHPFQIGDSVWVRRHQAKNLEPR